MILEKLNFPKYDGNETQYEHIFYTYLDKILESKGYVSKVKKTDFANIDDNIISNSSRGSCDSYILSNNDERSLFALLELESTGNLKKGIVQVKNYAKKLSQSYKTKQYFTNHEKIYLIVYDGQQLWIVEYNIKTTNEKLVLGTDTDGVMVDVAEKDIFINLFPQKNIINTQEDEKSLIKDIKNILRANKTLQGNKAFILTVLASIYGNTQKKTFSDSIEYLRTQASGDKETEEIYNKWKAIKNKIDYENSPYIKDKIKELYEKVSIKLYLLAQDKKLDLYGYIYEELAEKASKKEDGEYYTPRTHIRPVINSVFEKYLKNIWELPKNKKNAIEILKKKNVTDIFCGSAGFLYEYLKILKQNFGLSDSELNDIAFDSLSGFDKNDITSAYFNLFLVGDGRSKLAQVTTSINWQNFWKYELIENKTSKSKIKKAKKIQNNDKLIKSIESNIETFKSFLNSLINMEFIHTNFTLSDKYKDISTIDDFFNIYLEEKELKFTSYFQQLIDSEYKDDNNPVLKLFYKTLTNVSNDLEPISFKEFTLNTGNIDLLMTNVPYGDIDDQRIKGDYSSKLESQALKECIDLLKPSTFRKDNTTGKNISNEDGGIATIVIPNGLIEREEYELKKYLLSRCDILSIVKLPFYTFSPYALIQTYFITIRKKAPFEFDNYSQKHDVFMYIINNDGKANSDKRYETKLISNERIDVFHAENGIKSSSYEYIHDELSINLEQYPEGYFSKLERSWIYGNFDKFDTAWNQKRLTEKWNGKKWEEIDGKKWDYQKLIKKDFKKQTEVTNKKLEKIISDILIREPDFENLDLDEKKFIILKEMKSNYIKNIKYAKLHQTENGVILYEKETSKNQIQNPELKSYIFDFYKSDLNKNEKTSIEYLHNDLINDYNGGYNNEYSLLEDILESLDDIIILNNGDEIKFIKNIIFNLYDLNINNYLDNQKTMSLSDTFDSLIRLYDLQSKTDYSRQTIKENLKQAIEEINSKKQSEIIPLHSFISSYVERGKRITLEEIYNNYGEYPVYSSTITGNIGYFNLCNQEINENCLIYAIEGNAGSISIPISDSNKIWLMDVAGIIELKDDYLDIFSKESIALYLEYLFRNNRHNNSGQPKFHIKRNLDLGIDIKVIEILDKYI